MPKMLKQITVRLLLFGIPFALSYVATRPTTSTTPAMKTFVVCTSPGSRPGELRISLHPDGCPDPGYDVKTAPARSIPKRSANTSQQATIPF
jgi:hypothetical protein